MLCTDSIELTRGAKEDLTDISYLYYGYSFVQITYYRDNRSDQSAGETIGEEKTISFTTNYFFNGMKICK